MSLRKIDFCRNLWIDASMEEIQLIVSHKNEFGYGGQSLLNTILAHLAYQILSAEKKPMNIKI